VAARRQRGASFARWSRQREVVRLVSNAHRRSVQTGIIIIIIIIAEVRLFVLPLPFNAASISASGRKTSRCLRRGGGRR